MCSSNSPIQLPFPDHYWNVPIFHPISPQIKGGFMLSQYVVVMGQEYWETVKATPPIILNLILEYFLIPIIRKGLLGNDWTCS